MIMTIVSAGILGLFIGILGYLLGKHFSKVKTKEINAQIDYQNTIIADDNQELEYNKKRLRQEIDDLAERKEEESKALLSNIERNKQVIDSFNQGNKESAEEAFNSYIETLEGHYAFTEKEYDIKVDILEQELNKMKSAREAGLKAVLREKELVEKENFYKVPINADDLKDIELLNSIKPSLKRPEILSKLIWSTYYQKGMNTVCNNVVGEDVCSGIYKITGPTPDLCYIGQSVDIAKRWKDHVKAALGASTTTATNRFYLAMAETGVHNFTFEVLEKVTDLNDLNDKEKYYISFYQSDKYGLNSNKGVKGV